MPTDFVILWVDGNDPAWLDEKAQYQPETADDSNSANRFRDWGLLPYWFRAVEKFTPWVNKVHFVTWGHLPGFLNRDNKRLRIVSHRDFIPAEYLPTFSSHAIEMNIHRIPGLAEQFVYFNDDMFLLRPMPEESFFRDGLPCAYGGEVPVTFNGRVGIWQHAVANNLGLINNHFTKKEQVRRFAKKYANPAYRWKDNIRTKAIEFLFPDYFTGFKNLHAPAAYLKQTFADVWNSEPELLHRTSSHRFRSADDVNQWVALWWQVASGSFAPFMTDNVVNSIDDDSIAELCDIIAGQSHDMICINDPEQDVNFEVLSARLRAAFESILPDKCSFEK